MIEVRYTTLTNKVTGWCGDKKQFGNLDRQRPGESIVILNRTVPALSARAYLLQENKLVIDPAYTPPTPKRDLPHEFDILKERMTLLEAGRSVTQ